MTKKEYEETKKRVEKGEKLIMEAGGFLKAPKEWVRGYQILAERMLIYETLNDLLPI